MFVVEEARQRKAIRAAETADFMDKIIAKNLAMEEDVAPVFVVPTSVEPPRGAGGSGSGGGGGGGLDADLGKEELTTTDEASAPNFTGTPPNPQVIVTTMMTTYFTTERNELGSILTRSVSAGPIEVTIVPAIDTTSTPTDLNNNPQITLKGDESGAPNFADTPSSGGLAMGAKIGIGVAIPLVLILIGVGVFLFFRRKKQQRLRNEKGEVGEIMISGGKNGLDEDQSSGGVPSGSAGYVHPGPPPQGSDGHMYAPPVMQDPSGYNQGISAAPVVAPVVRRSPVDEEDLMNRPVSPVHDDDLLTEDVGGSTHTGARSGTALGGSIRDRGSPTLDDDREMQWILEEERKAKERREQQGRLPTHNP